MPKIENSHINPFGFREYDARWLYPKDINTRQMVKRQDKQEVAQWIESELHSRESNE